MSEPPKTPDDDARSKEPLLPPVEEEDETEMTSVMGSEERKVLLEAARTEAEREMATPLSQRKEDLERATARPPPEPAEASVAIPKAAAVPRLEPEAERTADDEAEAAPAELEDAPARAIEKAPVKPAATQDPGAMETWELVAFVMLAAAVAFALMR